MVEWDSRGAPPAFLFPDRQGWSGATGGFLDMARHLRCSAHRFQRHTRINSSHNVTRADRSFESHAQNQQLAQPMVVFVF